MRPSGLVVDSDSTERRSRWGVWPPARGELGRRTVGTSEQHSLVPRGLPAPATLFLNKRMTGRDLRSCDASCLS